MNLKNQLWLVALLGMAFWALFNGMWWESDVAFHKGVIEDLGAQHQVEIENLRTQLHHYTKMVELKESRLKRCRAARNKQADADNDALIAQLRALPDKFDCIARQQAWMGRVEGEARLPTGYMSSMLKHKPTQPVRLSHKQKLVLMKYLGDGSFPNCVVGK